MIDEKIIATNACTSLISRFSYYVDHRQFSDAVALFTEDGTFERPDRTAKGHAEIASLWEGRPESVYTHHLCYLPHFLMLDETVAKAVTAFTLYHDEHLGEGLPPIGVPAAVAEYHDQFRLTPDGWRIAHRRAVPLLTRNA